MGSSSSDSIRNVSLSLSKTICYYALLTERLWLSLAFDGKHNVPIRLEDFLLRVLLDSLF